MQEEKSCCCCESEKRTERSQEEKKKLINRLNRIEGQIRGIRAMIESDAYCNDILTQSAAVESAINAFSREVLSRHMHSCVAKEIREGDEAVIDELMDTLRKFMK